MKKRWKSLMIWITALFMLLTISLDFGQEPSLSMVLFCINHSPIHRADADSIGNVPLR